MLILGSTSSWLVPNAMGPPRLSEGMPPPTGGRRPPLSPAPPQSYPMVQLYLPLGGFLPFTQNIFSQPKLENF